MKNQIKRAIFSKGMLIVLFISIVLNALFIKYIIGRYNELNATMIKNDGGIRPLDRSPFNCFILINPTVYGTYYHYIIPLLCALPFAASYSIERKKGYVKNEFIRQGKINYIVKKIVATFISGGIAGSMPAVISFLWIFTYRPYIAPTPASGEVAGSNTTIGMLYFTHPFVYYGLFFISMFAICGCFALIALLISDFTVNVLTVLISPMFIDVVLSAVLSNDKTKYLMSSMLELRREHNYVATFFVVISCISFISIVMYIHNKNRDCY